MASGNKNKGVKVIANNKKAFHDYFIDEKYECGIELKGTEVKSLRMGKCSIREAYVGIEDGQMYIYGMNISPYEKGNIFNRDPLRKRRLLMHKNEIRRLQSKLKEKGYTLVPTEVYFKDALIKVQVGLARGKKLYDKRADIAKRDMKRSTERSFKIDNL
ncbi:MAG: SsrA-binding protein SmpB [Eubacteriales bacterium]|jgi:SsrA-binding protein